MDTAVREAIEEEIQGVKDWMEDRLLDLERRLDRVESEVSQLERTVEYDRASDSDLRDVKSDVDSLESRVQTLEYKV